MRKQLQIYAVFLALVLFLTLPLVIAHTVADHFIYADSLTAGWAN